MNGQEELYLAKMEECNVHIKSTIVAVRRQLEELGDWLETQSYYADKLREVKKR